MVLSMAEDVEFVGAVEAGDKALAIVQRENIDVVLMEVNLDRSMSGIEATRLIKQEASGTKILISRCSQTRELLPSP